MRNISKIVNISAQRLPLEVFWASGPTLGKRNFLAAAIILFISIMMVMMTKTKTKTAKYFEILGSLPPFQIIVKFADIQ